MRLPPPLPPSDFPALLRRSTTWIPEEAGLPRAALREARRLASEIASTVGRRDAIARYLLALAACRTGWLSAVIRIPLFQTPGLLLADPRKEAFYWTLDPGVPSSFEEEALHQLTAFLVALTGAASESEGETDRAYLGR